MAPKVLQLFRGESKTRQMKEKLEGKEWEGGLWEERKGAGWEEREKAGWEESGRARGGLR